MATAEGGADRNREIVARFMAATGAGDLDAVGDLVHDDFVMEWPQSGERFVGRENAFAAMRAQRVRPEMLADPRLVGSGDVWVLMVPLRYGAEVQHYAAVLELDGGRIRRATGYWGAPFPAQPHRAAFTDKA